jgi:methyl coenzyme M reductase subunit D
MRLPNKIRAGLFEGYPKDTGQTMPVDVSLRNISLRKKIGKIWYGLLEEEYLLYS